MPRFQNAMEIFTLLDKSNCRKCGEKTCLAFAGAVFTNRRTLGECPKLSSETIGRFAPETESERPGEQNRDEALASLQAEVAGLDLAEAAVRTVGRFSNGRLILKILGKDFGVDSTGAMHTDIHVNPWIAVPFLTHILYGKGRKPSGNWVSFRDLPNGAAWYPLFQKRCEEPIKQVADRYTDLFRDLVDLFNGRKVTEPFEADVSVVLHPLPCVPIMICYWMPEEGLASTLNLFFDETAEQNLDIGAIFTLGGGLAQMLERLSQRHGLSGAAA